MSSSTETAFPALGLKNRFVMAPMTTYASSEDGNITEEELAYLRRRAEGGFGMIMTAACYVHPRGKGFPGQWACCDDSFLPSLKSAADAIHAGGAKAVLQIHHGGRMSPASIVGTPLSASAIAADRPGADIPKAMTQDEIDECVSAFASAALRAKQAGYDGVEIHGANTYLLQQFVSSHSNTRDDAYGQDRYLFSEQITKAVIEAAGPGFPVGYRFSPEERETPGIRIADTYKLLDRLLALPIGWMHISLQNFTQTSLVGAYTEPSLQLIHQHIDGRVPLIGVGAIKTLSDAEAALELGCELVAVGKGAIADPEWVDVATSGNTPRFALPADGFAEELTVPKLLEEKIYSAPGWFEIEATVQA